MGNQIGRLKDKQAAIKAQTKICYRSLSDLKARINISTSEALYTYRYAEPELVTFVSNLSILRTLISDMLTDREIYVSGALGDALRNFYSRISNYEIILKYDGSYKENFIIMCEKSQEAFKDIYTQKYKERVPDLWMRLEKCLSEMFSFVEGLFGSASKEIGSLAAGGKYMIEWVKK